MAKKDERTIQLDPMEWRDSMKNVEAGKAKPAPKTKPGKRAKPGGKKP